DRDGAETVSDPLRGEQDRFDQLRGAVRGSDVGQVGAAFASRAVDPMTLVAAWTLGVVEEGTSALRITPVGQRERSVIARLPLAAARCEQRGKLAVACENGLKLADHRGRQAARDKPIANPRTHLIPDSHERFAALAPHAGILRP